MKAAYHPTVSVCMATFNGDRFLEAQVRSILQEMGPADELLISDDLSTDQTRMLIDRSCADPRVRLVGHSRAGGVVRNFERVLTQATGDLIVLSDQDDVWLPGKLALVREQLQQADLVMLDGWVVNENLVRTGQRVSDAVPPRSGFLRNFYKNSYVGCCMAFRSDLLRTVLPFPAGVVWHDWLIALVAERRFRVVRSHADTILYRRHGGNHSPTGAGPRSLSLTVVRHRLQMAWALAWVTVRGWFRPTGNGR